MADRSQFVEMISTHGGAMRRAAMALVGTGEADDAAQEATLRAWQTWDTLQDVGAARAWLLRITVNVCMQWRRGWLGKRIARTEPLAEHEYDPDIALISANLGNSDHTGAMDIRDALRRLAPEQRLVIVLHFYAGMSSQEAAEALNIPAATFRTRLRRALIALKNEMNQPTAGSVAHQEERNA